MSAAGDKLGGKVKETAGRATGDRHMEDEGRGQHAAGSIKEKATDVKKSVEGVVEKVTGH